MKYWKHESTLEILDTKGTKAQFHKRQRVRYLQDSIIAYQDQAWGDGDILIDYRCSPGVEVDRHRPGQKTYILISLRDVKRRGGRRHLSYRMGYSRWIHPFAGIMGNGNQSSLLKALKCVLFSQRNGRRCDYGAFNIQNRQRNNWIVMF